jgi:esterase/lipase superfamily enzyme
VDAFLAQFGLLDALLNNWDAIRIRMGPLSPALAQELAQLSIRLSAGPPDEGMSLVVRLLSLTRDTPAHDFVRDLVASVQPEASPALRSRELIPGFSASAPAPPLPLISPAPMQSLNGEMAQALAAEIVPVSVPVFFATNRSVTSDPRPEARYGGDLASLSFGLAKVTIPVAAHRLGQVETPHWWTPPSRRNDPRRFVVFEDLQTVAPVDFVSRLIASLPPKTSADLLLFLHGYNVTFEAAVRRAAQLAYDLTFNGIVVLFSWPSLGKLPGYLADAARAEASAQPLSELLELLSAGPWRKVHLLAHSMGNRVLVGGLSSADLSRLPIEQTVMVAADVEVTIFQQRFSRFPHNLHLPTSYASKADRALLLSRAFSQSARVGYIDKEPFVAAGLETIDASNVGTSLIGHSYYGDDRAVLTDLGYLLTEGLPAASRRGLKQPAGKQYWVFPR